MSQGFVPDRRPVPWTGCRARKRLAYTELTQTRPDPIRVDCPTCKAPKGERCARQAAPPPPPSDGLHLKHASLRALRFCALAQGSRERRIAAKPRPNTLRFLHGAKLITSPDADASLTPAGAEALRLRTPNPNTQAA